MALDEVRFERLRRRAVRLEWVTIGWNVAEVFITIGLGVAAGSIALIAFGTDSVVEVLASLVVVRHSRDLITMEHGPGTRQSLRLISIAFIALGVVLAIGALVRLLGESVPDESPIGVGYLAVTALVMLTLAVLKQRTGRQLGSEPLLAEARITYLDAGLATAVLTALVLNATLEWWWADPVAALIVAALALAEGREHWLESQPAPEDPPRA
ncbi:MAG: cation transporter [Acidimicrobiia bacterium]|nr:cation transporter [Acidimicrobiia bacterium]